MRRALTIVCFCFSVFLGAQTHVIAMKFSGASTYPTRVAYEVQNDKGEVLRQDFLEVKSPQSIYEVALSVSNRFAVLIYEDANANSEMDRGWFTQPLEKYAFSNEAWTTLSKPDLQEMLVPKTGNKTSIHFILKSVTDF